MFSVHGGIFTFIRLFRPSFRPTLSLQESDCAFQVVGSVQQAPDAHWTVQLLAGDMAWAAVINWP